MTQNPGDRKYGHGDAFTAQNPAEDVDAGDFVSLDAEGEVSPAGTELFGVAKEAADDGAYDQGTVEVQTRGMVWANVIDDGVTAGDVLTGLSSPGEGDTATTGSSTTLYAVTDAVQLDDGEGGTTSGYYAVVLLR